MEIEIKRKLNQIEKLAKETESKNIEKNSQKNRRTF